MSDLSVVLQGFECHKDTFSSMKKKWKIVDLDSQPSSNVHRVECSDDLLQQIRKQWYRSWCVSSYVRGNSFRYIMGTEIFLLTALQGTMMPVREVYQSVDIFRLASEFTILREVFVDVPALSTFDDQTSSAFMTNGPIITLPYGGLQLFVAFLALTWSLVRSEDLKEILNRRVRGLFQIHRCGTETSLHSVS
ncbi:hypothetical protein KIN20_027034 [Parelaphostrongylus tenuis]|uniref:Uncharacterized protein n=1 Tax=Parelaphostrongylus tenuis TaxID=148309 RepID=A0AAD5QYT0_PARTN|nr:hypothetical protein KIN20_027034 [Parelaphostrongylus tenuis]